MSDITLYLPFTDVNIQRNKYYSDAPMDVINRQILRDAKTYNLTPNAIIYFKQKEAPLQFNIGILTRRTIMFSNQKQLERVMYAPISDEYIDKAVLGDKIWQKYINKDIAAAGGGFAQQMPGGRIGYGRNVESKYSSYENFRMYAAMEEVDKMTREERNGMYLPLGAVMSELKYVEEEIHKVYVRRQRKKEFLEEQRRNSLSYKFKKLFWKEKKPTAPPAPVTTVAVVPPAPVVARPPVTNMFRPPRTPLIAVNNVNVTFNCVVL